MYPYTTAGLLALLTVHGVCCAQTSRVELIRFSYLKPLSLNEHSAISGECDGDTSSLKLTCRITQMLVRYQLEPDKVGAETEKRLSQFQEELKKDPRKFTNELCGDVRRHAAAIEEKLKGARNSQALMELQEYMRLCADPSEKNIEDWLRRTVVAESRTCKFGIFQNDPVTFKR